MAPSARRPSWLLTAAARSPPSRRSRRGGLVRLVNDLPAALVDPVKVFMTLGTITGVVVVAAVVAVATMRIGPPLAVLGAGLRGPAWSRRS